VSDSDRAAAPERVALGRIVRPQGLNGAVRVLPYGIAPEISARLLGQSLILRVGRPPGEERLVTLESQRWHRGVWIVELSDCATREAAEAIVGCELCLAEEDRPALGRDEYYPDQLVGLTVEDVHTGERLGEVVEIKPSAAADLLEVERSDGGRFWIPLVHAMINEVDLVSRVIRVDLPEGLIDLKAG